MSNLLSKYHITKNDGSPVDPNAQYFVLRIDTDLHARYAVYAYAASISDELADELRAWVKPCDGYDGAVEQSTQAELSSAVMCKCGAIGYESHKKWCPVNTTTR